MRKPADNPTRSADWSDACARLEVYVNDRHSTPERRSYTVGPPLDIEAARDNRYATVYAEFKCDYPQRWGVSGRWEWSVWPGSGVEFEPWVYVWLVQCEELGGVIDAMETREKKKEINT